MDGEQAESRRAVRMGRTARLGEWVKFAFSYGVESDRSAQVLLLPEQTFTFSTG